jgi:hypothetical protein
MSNITYNQYTASTAKPITTSDTVVNKFSGLYVGGAGTIKVTTSEGDIVTFTSPTVGQIIPIQTALVWATGTSATNLVGMAPIP